MTILSAQEPDKSGIPIGLVLKYTCLYSSSAARCCPEYPQVSRHPSGVRAAPGRILHARALQLDIGECASLDDRSAHRCSTSLISPWINGFAALITALQLGRAKTSVTSGWSQSKRQPSTTLHLIGRLLVVMATCAGTQMGFGVKLLRKVTPSRARRSRFGVLIT